MIFETKRNKEKMMSFLEEKKKDEIEIYAYCLMSNHLHLLLNGQLNDISYYMQAVETSYALYYNRRMDRNGHVFQNRFKSFPVESEDYLWQCFYYIHLNPVKAKITGKMERYPYSSAREYVYGKKRLISEEAKNKFRNAQMVYSKEKVIAQLEDTYIEDLADEAEEQKERILKKWIKIYLDEHQDLDIWDLKSLPKKRKDFVETMHDPRVMSKKELNRRIEQF